MSLFQRVFAYINQQPFSVFNNNFFTFKDGIENITRNDPAFITHPPGIGA
jgi:hypothetical protein